MTDTDIIAHDLGAGAARRRRLVRQLRQQDFLRGPTRIAETVAQKVAGESDRPVSLLTVRHHHRINVVPVHKGKPVAHVQTVHRAVDHGGHIAPHHLESFADRARGQRDVADDTGVPRLVLGTELQAELGIVQDVGADLEEFQITDQRHPAVRIGKVPRLETRTAQGL